MNQQPEQEGQQYEYPNNMGGNYYYPQRFNDDLVNAALNNESLHEQLNRKILAIEWNEEGRKWVPIKGVKPLLTKEEAYPIFTLSTLIDKNTTISQIEKREANMLARDVEERVNDHMLEIMWNRYKEKKDKFEFDRSGWQIIISLIGDAHLLAFNRAVGGNEMNILGQGTKTMIQKQHIEGKQTITEGKRGWGLFR